MKKLVLLLIAISSASTFFAQSNNEIKVVLKPYVTSQEVARIVPLSQKGDNILSLDWVGIRR